MSSGPATGAGPVPGSISGCASVPVSGVILAGGRSIRMGSGNKALALLAGRPLLQHVIDRLAPQVAALALSVERESPLLAGFGLPQLPDPLPGHCGPLGGLLAGLRHFADLRHWVLLVPCDAPFLPPDLAARLQACAARADAPAAVVVHGGEWQPTFSLWHRGVLPELERAVVRDGQAGFKPFLRALRAAECVWSDEAGPGGPPPFFNVNDPAALRQAARWIGQETPACQAC
jgi:molybdopterin-guanine dinucleotide biosynthesis protein A